MPRPRLLVVAALAAAGCGRPAGPAAGAAVRGTVFFAGRPLAGGVVVFAPDHDKGGRGRPVAAPVGPDGAFRVAADGSSGVPAGWYRVALADPPDGAAAGFPAALRRPDRAGLEREVKSGRENVFHFRVEAGE